MYQLRITKSSKIDYKKLTKSENELFVLAPNSVSGIHSADKVFLPFKICQEFLYLLRSTDFFAKNLPTSRTSGLHSLNI